MSEVNDEDDDEEGSGEVFFWGCFDFQFDLLSLLCGFS